MYKEEYQQQAFPNILDIRNQPETKPINGMTLLDYFAAKALQGRVARETSSFESAARDSYKHAAAMMEERKKYLTQPK